MDIKRYINKLLSLLLYVQVTFYAPGRRRPVPCICTDTNDPIKRAGYLVVYMPSYPRHITLNTQPLAGTNITGGEKMHKET